MPFPWELNLDRPYRHEKWRVPEQRAQHATVVGGSDEDHHEFPAPKENRQAITEDSS